MAEKPLVTEYQKGIDMVAKNGRLYGIEDSNRQGLDLFGKNQFNSTYPLSLAGYMKDKNIFPVSIEINSNLDIEITDDKISFHEIFGAKNQSNEFRYDFESQYLPYKSMVLDNLEKLDVVISLDEHPMCPLENKLTVLPDSATCEKDESEWGVELVIRPNSIAYACFAAYYKLKDHKKDVLKILIPVAENIDDWTNEAEVLKNKDAIINCLEALMSNYSGYQCPLILNTVWKTQGKSPNLARNAFDIFVWSNFALLKLAVDQAKNSSKMTRYLRSCAKAVRVLYDLFSKGFLNYSRTFTQMSFGFQTDKEFSLAGNVTHRYMKHPRLVTPMLLDEVAGEIMLDGAADMLSPERRFDATIFFTARNLFK